MAKSKKPGTKAQGRYVEPVARKRSRGSKTDHKGPARHKPRSSSQIDTIGSAKKTRAFQSRIVVYVNDQLLTALDKHAQRKDQTRAQAALEALQLYLKNGGNRSSIATEQGTVVIRSVRQALFHSRLVIAAFDEALEYDVLRQHNEPPPLLLLDSPDYLDEIRKLVVELRHLNSYLETVRRFPKRRAEDTTVLRGPVASTKRHINTFLGRYASTLGHGAGILTVGALVTLLYQLGLPETVFEQLIRKLH
ncbi:hypothetical protein SAMN05443254_11388 [Bradyrhizobium sp. OK095]|nr:hypothetical protein SAMN05443254_11388 [Bradyrhizobium sp. OK095]